MTRACKRCRPAHKLGIMLAERVYLCDGSMIEEYVSLCDSCREQAALENQAARQRQASIFDLPLLEFLFTHPSAKEPTR